MTVASALERPVSSLAIAADIEPARWDAFVAARPDASLYHTSAWRHVFERAFGLSTVYLAALQGGDIVGVLPLVFFRSRLFGRFAVSLPFVNYGGIVATSPAAARALLAAAIDETRRRGAVHLELRHDRRQFEDLPARSHKVAMRLRLAASDAEQWEALDRKVRNLVRKAGKSGVTVSRGGAELLPAFYDVFAANMRDLGTPVYSRRFFREVVSALPRRSAVFVANVGGRPVAAAIVLWSDGTMEVPWASSLRAFNHLATNMGLYWELLKFAIDRGCRVFDFGRSTPHEGTFEFKRQWGAEPVPLVWEYWLAAGRRLPDLSPMNPRYHWAIRIWQRLPIWLTRAVGPRIVRNIP
jgi:FemAB-related protein (PEP-CTERM system-associated)